MHPLEREVDIHNRRRNGDCKESLKKGHNGA